MDIITGVVVVTAVFFPSVAITLLFAGRSATPGSIAQEVASFASRVLATILIVYFLSLTELLLIAQQLSLALGTFVVGFISLGVLQIEPGLRPKRQPSSDGRDDWRH